MASEALADELLSVNAIYPSSLTAEADGAAYTLTLPSVPVSLRLAFPTDYPRAPPQVLGSAAAGAALRRGQASEVVDAAREVLGSVFQPDEPCVFDLIQELEVRFADLAAPEDEDPAPADDEAGEVHEAATNLGPPPPWVVSEAIIEKKSVFVARAADVGSRDEAQRYVAHLLATDKKAARATHNIVAWRIRGPGAVVVQDCDDDGETAAGGRVLHLLQLMDVWDVVVVVSRWYGGVHLGPDRFRLINACARDAVVKWRGG